MEIKADEDYEMVPLSPLRRLERRLEAMETTKTANGVEKFIDKVMDMVELNQKIVEDIVRSNQSMREDMSILIGKLDSLQGKISSFVEMVQSAAETDVAQTAAESTGETVKPIIEHLEAMSTQTQETNTRMLQSLENIEKFLKRPPIPTHLTAPTAAREILARRSLLPPAQQ